MTSDDGWASLKNILPWLKEQEIPVTLFLNPGYFDGQHFRERASEKYLLENDINEIATSFHNVSFGMHGWEHVRATDKDEDGFRSDVEHTMHALQAHKCFVPFYAYTWGKYNKMTGRVLSDLGVVPVMIDNETNRDDLSCIHRELLDGMKL
jgi:peptidoglycan/xylan/chitin deacetylase (PgdA/CDA1 family)